jgi:hypothetical protein
MAQQLAEIVEFQLRDRGSVIVSVSARDGVNHAAQERFVGREFYDRPRELLQVRDRLVLPRYPADLNASQHAYFDPHPLADQFAIRKHFKAFQDPTESIGVLCLESGYNGGKPAAILGKPSNGI